AADLEIGAPARLTLTVPADKDAWTGAHLDLIKAETSCVAIDLVTGPEDSQPSAEVATA
ncbi:Isoleucine-tRNA ligase, partial [human gut metagenome]